MYAWIGKAVVRAVIVFVLLYVGIFAVGAFALIADAARVDLPLRPLDGIAASAAMVGNIGAAFGIAGPMGSFAQFSDVPTPGSPAHWLLDSGFPTRQ